MKNINYVINGVLVVAVLVLFILHFSGKKNAVTSSETVMTTSEESIAYLPVAYINMDSLLENYIFSIDLNESLTRKEENASASFNQQLRNFQSEVEGFELKVRTGAFATQLRAEQEQTRLERRREDLQALGEKLQMEIMEERQRLNEQLRDTVMTHLGTFNSTKSYQIIFCNTSSSLVSPILLSEDAYNITTEFTDYLNKQWTTPSGGNNN